MAVSLSHCAVEFLRRFYSCPAARVRVTPDRHVHVFLPLPGGPEAWLCVGRAAVIEEAAHEHRRRVELTIDSEGVRFHDSWEADV